MPVALRCSGLVKRYGELVAVNGLDLEVRSGECFGLLGPNGAGKTTTVEIFEGLRDHDEGEVELLGQTWEKESQSLRQRLGIQLQETKLNAKNSVLETLTLFRSFYDRGVDPATAIAQVGLEEKTNDWVQKLSGGQKQRLSLACALVCEPEVLFLDEPTTGLDPQSRRKTWEIIEDFKGRGGTVLLTTHYMEEAERLCDRVAVIDHGKVIALGTPRELIASLGAEHVVEYETDSAVDDGAIRGVGGVLDLTRDEATVRLQVTEIHDVLPAVLAELERQQVELTQLTTHHATLEDVFVSLTGRHLRDE